MGIVFQFWGSFALLFRRDGVSMAPDASFTSFTTCTPVFSDVGQAACPHHARASPLCRLLVGPTQSLWRLYPHHTPTNQTHAPPPPIQSHLHTPSTPAHLDPPACTSTHPHTPDHRPTTNPITIHRDALIIKQGSVLKSFLPPIFL